MSNPHSLTRTIGLVATLHPTITSRKLGVVTSYAGLGNIHCLCLRIQLRSVHKRSSAKLNTCLPNHLTNLTANKSSLSYLRRSIHVNMSLSTTRVQKRDHSGHHHHHHHHHHDNTYLISENKKDAAVRITRIGLFINLAMAFGKGLGGYAFHSQALTADAIHSLTDLVSDLMTLATVSWSMKPPSDRFPNGYGKIESLGSLGVSGLLLGGGVMMGWSALMVLLQLIFPGFAELATEWNLLGHSHGHGHGHGHSHVDMGPNLNAAWLAAGSIAVKEWLYRATLKIAKERKSSVLASNAYHHRVDSLTALVALAVIGGSNFIKNAQWMDPVGGLIISLMVVQAGWANTKSALFELADVGIDDETTENVRTIATNAIKEMSSISEIGSFDDKDVELRRVQGLKSGQNYLISLEIGVPVGWSVGRLQIVEDTVRSMIRKNVKGVRKIGINFVQSDEPVGEISNDYVNSSREGSPEPSAENNNNRPQQSGYENTNEDVMKRK